MGQMNASGHSLECAEEGEAKGRAAASPAKARQAGKWDDHLQTGPWRSGYETDSLVGWRGKAGHERGAHVRSIQCETERESLFVRLTVLDSHELATGRARVLASEPALNWPELAPMCVV